MKDFIQKNRLVLLLYTFLLIGGVILLLFIPKADIHLYINRFHTPFFDLFFKYLTWLGSGWTVVLLFLLFLIKNRRTAIIFLAGNLLITAIVQGLKRIIFSDILRPVAFFNEPGKLHLVSGETMHHFNSFPSGHSATIFGIFIIFIYLTDNSYGKLGWLFLALITAFSRVYLSQHFLMDILAGSFIGIVTMGFTVYLFERYQVLNGVQSKKDIKTE